MLPTLPKTKIIATLGPKSSGRQTIRRLIEAGVAAFRLNLSHGELPEVAATIATIRQLNDKVGREAAIILDLPGPKMRLGALPEPLAVRRHDQVVFCRSCDQPTDALCLPHEIEELDKKVRPGEIIYIGDGMLQFKVLRRQQGRIYTEALLPGLVRSHKGINIPGYDLKAPSLTDYDRQCIAFGVDQRVDGICVSFVGRPQDIIAARRLLPDDPTYRPCLVAKIERRLAVEHFDAILAVADAVMVARGDL
ncbi:MAG: pyruvate kinase, partial [Desulfobulbaceae bacterium]|nr:pyruvate kinase [Desulfobulbaceae bacterium]